MNKRNVFLLVFCIISINCNSTNVTEQCPKQCSCKSSEDEGLKVKCEGLKDLDLFLSANASFYEEIVDL